MNVYTYYQNIDFSGQNELIELWKKSWESKGFNAIVLGKEDAESHPFYNEFCDKLKKIHLQIMGEELKDYGLSCYLRWLAYANTMKEASYACDYDVINIKLDAPKKINEDLLLYDNCCPCLASGAPRQFLRFCMDIIKISQKNAQKLQGKVQSWYHDQEVIQHNEKEMKDLSYVNIDGGEPNDRLVQLYKHQDEFVMNHSKVLHFAHASVGQTKENFPELKGEDCDELRLKLIKDILN